mgnify:CR=1 FL=1
MGSVKALRKTKVIDVPFDAPNTITVQKLTGKQLGKAQHAFWVKLSEQSREQMDLQKSLAELRAVIAGADGDVIALLGELGHGGDLFGEHADFGGLGLGEAEQPGGAEARALGAGLGARR